MKRMPARTLEPGTSGYVLKTSGGVAVWVPAAAVATDTIWDAKGDLAVGSGADAASKLVVGSNGQVLTADSTQTLGVKWAAAGGGISPTLLDAKGDLIVASADDTPARLGAGSNGQVLTADSTVSLGVKWANVSGSGSVPSGGSTGQVLTKQSGTDYDVVWGSPASVGSTLYLYANAI